MNKLLRLSFASLFLLAGCSKSGSDPTPTPAPSPAPTVNPLLVGTWKETSLTETTPASGGKAATTKTTPVAAGHVTKTYSADGIYSPTTDGKFAGTGSFTYSGNTLTLVIDKSTSVWNVSELTATRMVKSITFPDGIVDTYTYTH
jgi:hypothetical protein